MVKVVFVTCPPENAGEIASQADLARREGLTRARITQVMALLRLEPGIQESILSMANAAGRPPLTEHSLRRITHIDQPQKQRSAFQTTVGAGRTPGASSTIIRI